MVTTLISFIEMRLVKYEEQDFFQMAAALALLHPLLHPLQIINFVNKRFLQI